MKQLTDSQIQLTKNILCSFQTELKEVNTMTGYQRQIKEVLEILNDQQIEDGYHSLPLLKKVCEKIIHDHYLGDWTVIDELFKNHTTTDLEDLVSQKEN